MYTMGALLRHGSEEQKPATCRGSRRGELRLQAFAVTEPTAGSDTTSIQTTADARRRRLRHRRAQELDLPGEHSDLMLVLARTTPTTRCEGKTDGL